MLNSYYLSNTNKKYVEEVCSSILNYLTILKIFHIGSDDLENTIVKFRKTYNKFIDLSTNAGLEFHETDSALEKKLDNEFDLLENYHEVLKSKISEIHNFITKLLNEQYKSDKLFLETININSFSIRNKED